MSFRMSPGLAGLLATAALAGQPALANEPTVLPALVERVCRPFARAQIVERADHGFVAGLTACARLVADGCGEDDDG